LILSLNSWAWASNVAKLRKSSASARTWHNKIKAAQKAHDTAQRFVHRYRIFGHEAQRISHRIVHLKTLLEELK